jgi:site-specific DNA-methyltransferase (adenine-specific)
MNDKTRAFNMDCMEALKTFPDKHFELAILDTPYGIGEDGSRNESRSKKTNFGVKNTRNTIVKAKNYKSFSGQDKEAPPAEYWDELFRVSQNQIIWGANHFISRIPFDSSCWIVWDKLNGECDFADCELAWTSFDTAVRKFPFRWNGMLQGDMANKEIRIHPTQKPIPLYKWLLKNYAKEGDKILDTHLGSGSSRIAAFDMGFDFTGYELDKDYFEASEKRFNQHKAQLKLFV